MREKGTGREGERERGRNEKPRREREGERERERERETFHGHCTLILQCFGGEDHTPTDRSAEGGEAPGVWHCPLSSCSPLCVCVSMCLYTYIHTHTQTLSVCLSVCWALWVGRELRCRGDVRSEDETAFLTGSICGLG